MQHYFKNESKIKAIGGKLMEDYLRFREVVLFINANYIPLFLSMGFRSPEDTETVLDALLKYPTVNDGAKDKFITHTTRKIEEGKISLNDILSKNTLTREYPTPEEKETVFNRQIHRALCYRYKSIYDEYIKKYSPSAQGISKYPLIVCGSSLSLTPRGFEIDVVKFIETYEDYMEANGSKTGKHHQDAADAINRFFNGLEITDKELKKYFLLESGRIKINPQSINKTDYARLGYRGKAKVNRV